MADKARFYRFDLCDGHGCEPRIIAAQSKADAKNVIAATVSQFQKSQNLRHLGWCNVRAQPDETDGGVAFVATVEGRSVTINRMHSSHSYLTKQFAKQTQSVEEFLNGADGDEL